MNSGKRMAVVAITISCAALAGSRVWPSANARPGGGERGRLAFSHALPRMDGHHLLVKVVEVNYGPGESSPAHSHPCPVIGYVALGTLRTQVQGEPEETYKAGESFYEAPNGVHALSANASQTEPAKLIAYFVCDRETPLSVAPPGEKQP
jgi:quercetin dioxygenase-like cupin family protein